LIFGYGFIVSKICFSIKNIDLPICNIVFEMLLEMFCLKKVLTVFMVITNDSISKKAERVFVFRNLACYEHVHPQKLF